jgi:hypothetical protein
LQITVVSIGWPLNRAAALGLGEDPADTLGDTLGAFAGRLPQPAEVKAARMTPTTNLIRLLTRLDVAGYGTSDPVSSVSWSKRSNCPKLAFMASFFAAFFRRGDRLAA